MKMMAIRFKLIITVFISVLTNFKAFATTTGCLWNQPYGSYRYLYTTPYTGPYCSGSTCYASPGTAGSYYLANMSCLTITSTPCTIVYGSSLYYGVIASHEGTAAGVTGAICNTDIDGYAGVLLGAVSITSVFFFNRRNKTRKK